MARQVVSFHYTLKDDTGQTIDSSVGSEPMMFLEGAGQIIQGLESQLATLKKGEKKKIDVPYIQAYGPFDEKLIFAVSRDKFPNKAMKPGDMFRIKNERGYQLVTVVDIKESEVTLDGNHPLAGKDLHFSVEIIDIRDATQEELEHGHVHGPGGHHH